MRANSLPAVRLAPENVWFSGATSLGRLRWMEAFASPSCGQNATITWWMSLAGFVAVLVTSVLSWLARSAAAREYVHAALDVAGGTRGSAFADEMEAALAARAVLCPRSAESCPGAPVPFAFTDWVSIATLAYFLGRWLTAFSGCAVLDRTVLRATSPLPAVVRMAWAAHVLALSPAVLDLAFVVRNRGPWDLEIALALAATRVALLGLDFLLARVPVMLEHAVWPAGMVGCFAVSEALRQAGGGAPASSAIDFAYPAASMGYWAAGMLCAALMHAAFFVAARLRDAAAGVNEFDGLAPAALPVYAEMQPLGNAAAAQQP